MSTFLDRILESRRAHVEELHNRIETLQAIAREVTTTREFREALAREGVSLIAEIKRRSPSKGPLSPSLDPASLALAYERGGAAAISVLTEPEFFGGSSDDVAAVHDATHLPILWKDFVLDRVQIVEACARRADAILLIVRILGDELPSLVEECKRWGLCPLVEVFDERDVERALDAEADVIGVNHRDLETFDEDPTATKRLRASVPDDVVLVAESAISTRADIDALAAIGVDAALVGEAIVTSPDPEAKVRELAGH